MTIFARRRMILCPRRFQVRDSSRTPPRRCLPSKRMRRFAKRFGSDSSGTRMRADCSQRFVGTKVPKFIRGE
jgi:hypothetical protein